MTSLSLVILIVIICLGFSLFIQTIEAETAPYYEKQWGSEGLQKTGLFSFPQDLALDSSGNVYVVDYGNRRIQKFDNDGNFLQTWGNKGSGNGQFQAPSGIAIGNDFVYVVDNDLNRVQKFDTSGKYMTQWGEKGSKSGQFLLPQNIAVDPSGYVYVADTGNNRIQKFSADGKFLSSWGSSGLENGQFLNLHGIAVDSQGNVYVSDSGNNRIEKFTSDGIFAKSFDESSGNSLRYPQGLHVDSSGNIYVADTGNNRIVKFSRDGVSLASWGSQGQANGNFNNPKDVIVDSDENVFVADSSNHRIQKFAKTLQTTSNTTDPIVSVTLSPSKNDKTNPVITAPSDIKVEANGLLSSANVGQATATDSSGIASLVNNAPSKFPLGSTVVTWTATDASGNTSKATQTVTVVDTTSPVIAAPPSVIVEATSPDGNSVELGTPTTSDVVAIATVTNDAPVFFKLGDTIVTWTATDAAGNSASSKQVVSVQDTTRPKITAPSDTTIEATSISDNGITLGDATVTDNGEIKSITNDAPTTFPLGQTIVTWTATDAQGNSSSATQIVSVIDSTAPNLVLPEDMISEATSPDHNVISIGQATASDAVGIVSVTNNAPIDFPFGKYIVTWTATDTSGNSISSNQTITIVDTTVPELRVPKDVNVEASDPISNILQIGDATATDIIGIGSITNDAPDTFPIGLTTVTWIATDTSGNTVNATQTVIVQDTTNPTITAPIDLVVEASSPTENIVSIGEANATDNIGISSVTNDAPAVFPVGETMVTWTATDNYGNFASAIQKITVTDTTGPVISVPQDVISEAVSQNGNIVDIGVASAIDSIDPNPVISNDSPSSFPLGETVVTWTAADQSGNTSESTQKITVIDTTAPTIIAPDDIEAEATSATENTVTIGQATAADFVGISSVTNDAPAVFPVGETMVTWTATDTSGHSTSAQQKIIIKDTTPPVLNTPNDIIVEATNEFSNIVNIGEAKGSDLVGIQSITNDAPDVFPLGLTTITWTVTDVSELSFSAVQKINVVDTTAPTLTVPPDVVIEATSATDNSAELGQATASDLLRVSAITNDAPSTFPLGETIVTWTATDESGNSVNDTQKITVEDTTAPTIKVPDDITIEATSLNSNTISIGDAKADDNVGVISITNDSPDLFTVGDTIITWTVNDAAGNLAKETQTVHVIDTTKPSILSPEDIVVEATDPLQNFVTLGDANASDAVGIVSVTNDAPNSFAFGKTEVTWTATDAAGNSSTDIQEVTVADTTAPKVTAPVDVKEEAISLKDNVLSIGEATAKDIMGISTLTNDAPDSFPFGETVVTWTATDPSGNSATATQKITIIDTTGPTLAVPENVTIDATSQETPVSIGDASATDIIDPSPKITNDAPSTFPLGETIVTWTATDEFGNSNTLTQKVTVQACGKPASSYNLIIGGQDNDILTGTHLDDLIFGLGGDDIITGEEGNDCIFGGEGDDIIFGNNGDDTISGDNGSDIIRGGSGEDILNGNSGFDVIDGGDDPDSCNSIENIGDDIVTKCESGKL